MKKQRYGVIPNHSAEWCGNPPDKANTAPNQHQSPGRLPRRCAHRLAMTGCLAASKKIWVMLLCLSLCLGLLPGCVAEDTPYVPSGDALAPEDADVDATEAPEEVSHQELTLAYDPDESMNPFESTDLTNRTLFSLIYQGLFSIDRNNQAIPILCSQFRVSSDSRTYTFYLVDATFADGSAVTAEDVLASYQAAMESTYYEGRFIQVKEVALSEDGGITFTLRSAMEDLPLLLDVPIVKASQVAEEHPIGSGPYVMEDALYGGNLRRNNSWWCTQSTLVVTAENIPLIPVSSVTQIRDEFEFGEVGLVCADPCSGSYADYRCDYELWDCENGTFLFLAVNVAYSQDDIFRDENLRAALTYAIDREKIVAEYYRGYAQAASIPCSPSSPYYSASLASKYEYDPVQFIEAVNRAKKPKETLKLLVNRDDSTRLRVGRAIVEMLQECGLDIELYEQTNKMFVAKYIAGDYDLVLGQTRLSANMDLSPFYRAYGELGRNGVANSDVYDLCQDALENQGNFYNLHKAAMEDGRVIPILFGTYAVYATRGLLTELEPARDNVFFYSLGRTESDALIQADYGEAGAG